MGPQPLPPQAIVEQVYLGLIPARDCYRLSCRTTVNGDVSKWPGKSPP